MVDIFKKYSDEDLLQDISVGKDDRALKHLYKMSLPQVRSYVMRNQGSIDEANDIFQDAVIRFYNAVKRGQFLGNCSVQSFVFGISKNLWINAVKKKGKNLSDALEDTYTDGIDLEKNLISQEKTQAVEEVLQKLGSTCSQLLKLAIYEDLSMKQIALQLGLGSEDVAKTYNYRCKQKMIKMVEGNTYLLQLFDIQ